MNEWINKTKNPYMPYFASWTCSSWFASMITPPPFPSCLSFLHMLYSFMPSSMKSITFGSFVSTMHVASSLFSQEIYCLNFFVW